MNLSDQLFKRLKNGGLDFFVSVPCKYLDDLISIVEKDSSVIYTPVTREEEGLGISAGAFLGGKRPAMIMQNSGLGNSINAVCSLLNYFEIPMVFIISHRGIEGEVIEAQMPMGKATTNLLDAAEIPFIEIKEPANISRIDGLIQDGFKTNTPVALLFPPIFWKGGREYQ